MVQDGQIMTNKISSETTQAKRLSHNPWRDRRVFVGIAVVLSSAVLGGSLWMVTTSSQSYWAVTKDVVAGEKITQDQVRLVELTAPDQVSQTLIPASSSQPNGVWAHGLNAGSLVTVDSVDSASLTGQKLPMRVAVGSLPSELATGAVVNVWVGPRQNQPDEGARRVLTDVKVVHVSRDVGAAERTVLIDVGSVPLAPDVVAAVAEQHVTVVQIR